MSPLLHHASIASMSLVGSSLLTTIALMSPLGLIAVTAGAVAWMARHEWRRK